MYLYTLIKEKTKNKLVILLLCSFVQLFSSSIDEKVLICGVCKNIAPKLHKTSKIMEKIGSLFKDYRILVYENNSKDKTVYYLKKWRKKNPRVWLKSEFLSHQQLRKEIININTNKDIFKNDGPFLKTETIAKARNIVLKEALTSKYEDFPFIIWIDMDFTIEPDYEGFIDTFQSEKEWDAVFAYGIAPDLEHWDWYALRDTDSPIGPELLGQEWWYNMPRLFSCKPSDPWKPVYSAFGGCGIYRKKSIKDCFYSGLVTPDLETHVKTILTNSDNIQIQKYFRFNNLLSNIKLIKEKKWNLPNIKNPNTGIILNEGPDPVIWRMNIFVYKYPPVCEHVPFHASMIVRGYDKLYVNPKLVFRYGE